MNEFRLILESERTNKDEIRNAFHVSKFRRKSFSQPDLRE